MALKVTVGSNKPEVKSNSVGLIKRNDTPAASETENKNITVTMGEVVAAVLEQLSSTLQKEADVELELTAAVDLSVKEGQQVLNLDITSENPTNRTLKLKFTTKLQPQSK